MSETPATEVRMISVNEVANRLGVSYDTITDLCRAGLLQSFKINRRRVISAPSFEAFVSIQLQAEAKSNAAALATQAPR